MTTTIQTAAAVGADVINVQPSERIITVIVVPYEQPAIVEYRGQLWEEVFSRGAFNAIADIDPQRIRVNREHTRGDTVGKVIRLDTNDPRGLIADIRVAPTSRGDDTLALAGEGMLSASVGFAINPARDESLDVKRRVRRINRAVVDHVSLVESPAYDGARVLSVRRTPNLDEYLADPAIMWAEQRSAQVSSRNALAETRDYLREVTAWRRRRETGR